MDDPIDELFREAAKNYSLNSNSYNWDKVQKALKGKSRSPIDKEDKSFRRKSVTILALLAGIVIICTTFIEKVDSIKQHKAPTADNLEKTETSHREKNYNGETKPNKVFVTKTREREAFKSLVLSTAKQNQLFYSKKSKKDKQRSFETPSMWPDDDSLKTGSYYNQHVSNRTRSIPPVLLHLINTNANPNKVHAEIQNQKNKIEIRFVSQKKKLFFRNMPRLYAGIITGPDLTTIKSQKAKRTGYSLGVFTGYKISNWSAIETGILWDRKEYYTRGEYFKTNKIYLPPNAKIIDASGYCAMFEIPINLKIDWGQKERYNWFATTGFSSYLMKKEKYTYTLQRSSSTYPYNKEYKSASSNWLSVLNLSIGYETKLSRKLHFRLEPYLKLPIKGLGIGSMPITSRGIFVSLSQIIE